MGRVIDPTFDSEAKADVYEYWNSNPCETNFRDLNPPEKYSRGYFEAIEELRYTRDPGIHAFAQFPRFHGCKVLEVGVGAGTDFLQWVRAGAEAYGIDLTSEAVEHVRQRLRLYDLRAADVRVADCENLPYPDNAFDLVYSWGVIHHTPNLERALSEIVRVCRPGGMCKVMVYNRHSLAALYVWVRNALLRGRPWKSLAWCISRYVESPGTQALTMQEMKRILSRHPIKGEPEFHRYLTYWDTYHGKRPWIERTAYFLSALLGLDRLGWFMMIQFHKT
ncbi:MAG TPA: class I SAM-dependent methyltransferase [bacterium]|nr:class I SAM-dependent methyltransferase [bacterium]